MLESYVKFFQTHERLLIIIVVGGLLFMGWNKWLDKSAMDAKLQAAVAQQIAQVQRDADAKIAASVAQQTALFNQAQVQHEQEIASLVAAVASRDAASYKQVKQVKQSTTTPEAVADLNAAYKNLPSPLTVDEAASVPLADLQQFTIAAIERDTVKADLSDTKKQLDSTTTQLDSAVSLDTALQGQVTGLQAEIKTNDAAAKKELDSCKADARKGKMTWFKRGFIVGFVAGIFTGHSL